MELHREIKQTSRGPRLRVLVQCAFCGYTWLCRRETPAARCPSCGQKYNTDDTLDFDDDDARALTP